MPIRRCRRWCARRLYRSSARLLNATVISLGSGSCKTNTIPAKGVSRDPFPRGMSGRSMAPAYRRGGGFSVRPLRRQRPSAAFELGDEEHLAALTQLLEVSGGVVDRTIDRDGGLLLEVVAEPRIHLVERLDDVAQGARLDFEF